MLAKASAALFEFNSIIIIYSYSIANFVWFHPNQYLLFK